MTVAAVRSDAKDWLLADIDGETATFALATPGDRPSIHNMRRYPTRDFPTATDAFIAYARDAHIHLSPRDCALVVSGPLHGDTIRVARCPWVLTLQGLGHILGRPPLAVNDSAVKSWANLAQDEGEHRLIGGAGSTDFNAPGRWATINFENGLGASLLVRRPGERLSLFDGEIGHTGFSPRGESETALHAALQKLKRGATWELALLAQPGDPIWIAAGLSPDRRTADRMRATMLGSFAGGVVLALGGWNGVFLYGIPRSLLANGDCLAAFNAAFEDRTAYRSEVRRTPRWTVAMDRVNLVGAARMLARSIGKT
ncbi:glucokinase [Novosphingopyxis sp.]|uniref:glucokinase n=1 Tax=Novosphingopyxis sp. TaxID=2709690 RepID=UPI003B5A142A